MKSRTAINTGTKTLLTGGFWVRVVIIAAAGFIFMQKDINFQIHVQSPLYHPTTDEQPKETGEATQPDKELSDVQSGSSNRLKGLSASLFGFGKRKTAKNDLPIPKKKQPTLKEVETTEINAFIDRFSNVAVSEMRKFGIPASVTLANGLYFSAAGKTDFAKQANNYFQIPCDSNWDGSMKDFEGQCYKNYDSAWSGFRDHSDIISQNHASLKKLGRKDYKAWAKGLQKGKFNPQKNYSNQLISIIEKYNLDRFDQN